MKWLRVPLMVAFLGFAGCGPNDSSAHATQRSAGEISARPVRDQPVRNTFPTASEVRLFVNTDYDDNGEPIFSKSSGLVLSSSQRAELESLIMIHTISPDEEFAACFVPHHFFRYFDKSGKLVGEVEACFCCAGVRQTGASNIHLTESQMLSADFGKLQSFVRSLGERTDVQCEGEI